MDIMELQDRVRELKKHEAHAATPAFREYHDVLLALIEDVGRQQTLLIATAVEKLACAPGDILLLKIGDPAVGWVPSSEDGDELLRRVTDVLPADARPVVWNYGIQATVIRPTN